MYELQRSSKKEIFGIVFGFVAVVCLVFSIGFRVFAEDGSTTDYSSENEEIIQSTGEDLNEEINLDNQETDKIVEYVPIIAEPITVIVQPDEDIPVLASYTGSVYNGTISTTYLDFFEGIVLNEMPENYVCFRQSQYIYSLYYGDDLTLNGTTFRGSGLKSVSYNSQTGNGTVSRGSNETLNVNAGTGFVYSNLGGFSSFDTYKNVQYIRVQILATTVLIGLLFLKLILFNK